MPTADLRDVMRVLERSRVQIALVVDDENVLLGTCTDGDVRRALLSDGDLDTPVARVMNKTPVTASDEQTQGDVIAMMRRRGLLQVPVVDRGGRVISLMLLADPRRDRMEDIPIVLMVGGMGKRLRPLTENCPKPMLEIAGRPLLERIIERFAEGGFRNFFLSINYLGHVIEEYFGSGERFDVSIEYLREDQRLGTGGALGLLPPEISGPIIVMNGDVLTDLDFRGLVDIHVDNEAAATMCIREHRTSMQFGVVEFEHERYVKTVEKPTLAHYINAGVYCVSASALDVVPRGRIYDMPEFFEDLVDQGRKCVVHKISASWLDIGSLKDFERANQMLQHSSR